MSSLNKNTAFIFLIFNLLMLVISSSFANVIYVNDLSYDQVHLNSKTWQEVDMTYRTTIDGTNYLNTIKLLRPKAYLAQHHMNQVGQKVTLTLPKIGLNHNLVTITAIKPAPQFKTCHPKKCSQVIGLFKHYVANVKIYRFKDLTTGRVVAIHATPNHPFYVKNKHQFLSINQVSNKDQLVGESNHLTQLICKGYQSNHCGIVSNKGISPQIVYNIEVYQYHNYLVSTEKILVHNCDMMSMNDFMEKHQEPTGIARDYMENGENSKLFDQAKPIAKSYSKKYGDTMQHTARDLFAEEPPTRLQLSNGMYGDSSQFTSKSLLYDYEKLTKGEAMQLEILRSFENQWVREYDAVHIKSLKGSYYFMRTTPQAFRFIFSGTGEISGEHFIIPMLFKKNYMIPQVEKIVGGDPFSEAAKSLYLRLGS